jgi:tetratricopeptide (TPR) repeat protein
MLLDEKEFEQALDKANEGLELDPENLTCLNARSVALNKLKRTEDAIETMQNALAQDPDNEHTHATVGWNLLEKGRHREAETHFLEALRINPNFSNAQQGMKEAMKSKIPPYKWMLQYSFWMHNQGKGYQKAAPIFFYILFRILSGVFESNESTAGLGWIVGGLYILLMVTSWTINSIANVFLMFHPRGKYALTVSERWSSITAVSSLVLGISLLCLGAFTSVGARTDYADLFIPGMILVSLALPLSGVNYPVSFAQTTWKEKYTLGLAAAGIATLLVFAVAPAVSFPLFVLYGLAFIVYTWTGA